MARIATARTLHDVGLAAWFGGTLAGAVGFNGAAGDARDTATVANSAWARWTPVNLVAIGAHLAGGALIVRENQSRIVGQKGVAGWTAAKTALTGAALLATGYSRLLGKKLKDAGDFPADSATVPASTTPPEVAKAQQQLRVLQWAIPALTGGILLSNAYMGEQQRPAEVAKGIKQRAGEAISTAVQHPTMTAAASKKAVLNAL